MAFIPELPTGFAELSEPKLSSNITNATKPWISQQDVFFEQAGIYPERWNQVFGYRLVVIDVTKENEIVGAGVSNTTSSYEYFNNGTDFRLIQQHKANLWEFGFPITPQQLSIQDVYAISNTPTLRGIVEEHNGIKYKNITMAGTFGVFPNRTVLANTLPGSTGLLSSLFAGTLSSIGNAKEGLTKISNNALGKHPNSIKEGLNSPTKVNLTNTGYFNALLCGQFIEQYAIAKKDPKNAGYRLVLDMPKRNESFIVTPMGYTSTQSIAKPAEYMFSLQFKAWKRINLNTKTSKMSPILGKMSMSKMQQINQGLKNLRMLIAQATNVLKAIRSDFQAVLNTVRQLSLLVKDIAGFIQTAIDLGPNMLKDLKDTIKSIKSDLKSLSQINTNSWKTPSTQAQKALSAQNKITKEVSSNEGISAKQINSGDFNKSAGASSAGTAISAPSDPVAGVFDEPEANFKFFDDVAVSSITLTQNQRSAIEDELTLIRLTNTQNLKDTKELLKSVASDLANHYGAGSASVNKMYNKDAPKKRTTPMTIEENELIQAFFEVISGIDSLTASKQFDTNQQLRQDSLSFVGGLASDVNIQLDSYTSKIQAPVPYGLTVEQIAMRYLGSPDKWIELVTLNALREPYIDEVGFIYPLLSNADGRSFTVNDSQLKLFIGQKIKLYDNVTLPFIRKIQDINKISDTSFLITVGGDADLTLSTSNNANLQAYLPGTVNSQNIIYIPSNQAADPNSALFPIPNLKEDPLNDMANVDFLVDESGDLAINSAGDFRFSNGLTNLIQTLRLKIQTKKGSLLRHKEYGLGITPGMSTADINSGEIIRALNEMIAEDSRFQSIQTIQVTLQANVLNINMVVTLANRTGTLPINFDTKI